MKVANVDELEEWKKCVAICFDEVKVKEGIVYDKHDCRVIGFVDFGDVNNAMSELERSDNGSPPAIAKQMLVFMVRGIFFRLTFPYAQFATRDLSADILLPMVCTHAKFPPMLVSVLFLRCGKSFVALSVLGFE